jgi:hypothetical protein
MTAESSSTSLPATPFGTAYPPDRPRHEGAFPRRGRPTTGARVGRIAVPADRVALAGLLVGTGLLDLWGLGESGWANTWVEVTFDAQTVDGVTVYDLAG